MMTDSLIEHAIHIGILAGTAEGAALCYRTMCGEADEDDITGRNMHPEITLHALPLRYYLDAIDRDDWGTVAALMSHSASKLVRAGADVIVCPNNTLHNAFDLVESPVPWLHIAKPVVNEIAQRGWRRVGILGTQIVMEGAIYSSELEQREVAVVTPNGDDRVRIQRIIRTELVAGRFTAESRLFLQKVIAKMAAEGAEAVILGCTELPLLLSKEQSDLPLLDSTRLLAQAALNYGRQLRGEYRVRDCLRGGGQLCVRGAATAA
ncbi:MAG: amino acid racemase [Nitrospira sp.]|nr:amino acid racemase [Nitrospira sp.]